MAGNGPSVHHAGRPRLNHSRSGRGSDAARPPPETAATLPQDSAVAKVLVEIDELIGDSGEARVVTLLFRGNAITPDGLSQMDTLIGELVSDPSVGPILAPGNQVIAPSFLVKLMLQVESFESVTQADIDSARGPHELEQAIAAMTGTDTDGTAVAVATIRLRDTGSPFGSVADTVPTTAPTPASSATTNAYVEVANSGGRGHITVAACSTADGSLHARSYVTPLPNALTRNSCPVPHDSSPTVCDVLVAF